VLARAVHADARGLAEFAHHLVAGRGVTRPGGRTPEVLLAELGEGEDVADDGDVTIGAGMARGRQPEPLALEGRTRGEAGQRLERLEAGTGEDQRRRIAQLLGDRAVGGEHEGDAGVPRLDESAAFDNGEFDGVGCGEGLRHPASLPPRRRSPRMTDCAHVGRASILRPDHVDG